MVQNGIIETIGGDLLTAGFCDFEDDSTYDSLSMTIMNNVPFPASVRRIGNDDPYLCWDGVNWINKFRPVV